MLRIRQTDELDDIYRLDRQLFPHDAPIPTAELDDALWWTAEMGGEVVGYAGMQVLPDEVTGRKGYLHRAGVMPQARGAGIQQRLIRARCNWARRLGVPRVYTYVWVGNVASMRSLVKCGFLPYYSEKPGDQTWLYLDKRLDGRPRGALTSGACATETSSPALSLSTASL